MQANLLKNVVSLIVGQNASGIVDLLHNKKNVNEFIISKKLKLTINQTRNILYKLADEGLVSFLRKKDRKKGGWYIYFWTLNAGKGLLKFKENLTKSLESLENQLKLKTSERFYCCTTCNLEYGEENALLSQYTCPECGEVLQVKDKTKEVEGFKKEIAKLKEILIAVEQEIGTITKKEESIKARKQRFEDKKKIKERALNKKKREFEKKKLNKKSNKLRNKKSEHAKKKKFSSSIKKKFKKFFRR